MPTFNKPNSRAPSYTRRSCCLANSPTPDHRTSRHPKVWIFISRCMLNQQKAKHIRMHKVKGNTRKAINMQL